MKNSKQRNAYIIGILIAIMWGSTFISSKILLQQLEPIEILLFRFLIGYLTLTIIKPKPMPFLGWILEGWCLLAGTLSVTIYFMCESSALQFTNAGNVGIIVSLAPLFTAFLSFVFIKDEKPNIRYFLGSTMAIFGILFINVKIFSAFHFDVRGYFLALAAAFAWAMYSIIIKRKIQLEKYMLEATKRILFYGVLTALPLYFLLGVKSDFSLFMQGEIWGNLLFLGVGASGIGYLGWNKMVSVLGSLKATIYIYIIPVVTFLVAFLILGEEITFFTGIGGVLVIAGLIISEKGKNSKSEEMRPFSCDKDKKRV